MTEVADLDAHSFDFLFHYFLSALSIIQHPQRLVVLGVDLPKNHYIAIFFVPSMTKKKGITYNHIIILNIIMQVM